MTEKKAPIADVTAQEAMRLRALWNSTEHPGQAVFGEEFDIGSQSAVGQFLRGLRPLSLKAAIGFARGLKCSIEDFSPRLASTAAQAAAVGLPQGSSSGSPAEEVAQLHIGTHEQMPPPSVGPSSEVIIPQYDAFGAMGPGFVLEDNPPGLIKSWHVDEHWLRLNVPVFTHPDNLCIVTGFGPSMKPRFNPGDPLLCDRGVTSVDTDGVYFFSVGRHGFIKQLQRIPTEDGMILRAKSFNKDYDPFDITAKMEFQLFGKILTAWRSEQF
ncbi:helix-turn-helix transcriptional regulator [Comamonas odontotermitis]|uniref:S24 family peptidase n=1 Tax=Comamonas odontotermitis TaxID=379895 RepID=UPI00375278DE